MNTKKILLAPAAWLSIGLALLVSRAEAASTSTFQLQMRSRISNANGTGGPQGWASSVYSQHHQLTNQTLQLSCRGLLTNRNYHLMASFGTNGELMHLSDFKPAPPGAILLQYLAGSPHHFSGTNNPALAWGMMGGWTNRMSWVIFPGGSTNWCDWMDDGGGSPYPMRITSSMGSMDGMGGLMGGSSGWMGGWSMGWMGSGWPAMTNWWSGMSNWWPIMSNWCWGYTNMWNAGMVVGSGSTNWWGSLSRGAYHRMPLPPSANPVPAINGLVVMDENLQPVLSADLANPDTFTYQVRCELTNPGIVPGARAILNANATQRTAHFGLSATGLVPSSTYYMEFNGANVVLVASDRHGRLHIHSLPNGVTNMRGIGSVSILDKNYNAVLSTSLPPN